MTYIDTLNKVADTLNLKIVKTHSVGDDLLEIRLAHKDSLEALDLETVSQAASLFAEAIDYEIGLDVSSEGAERELVESEYGLAVGKYVYIKLINPEKGYNEYEGDLVSLDDETIIISVRVKHTSKEFTVDRKNIKLLRLAVKV